MKKILFFVIAVVLTKINSAQTNYFGLTPPGNTPQVFALAIISGYVHGRIAISPSGDEIYWVINPSTERIFNSKLENGIWTKPALSDFVKDYLTTNNGGVAFSPDSKRLFFYSDRPGGMGKLDCWYVEKTDSGWSKPVNAGSLYNSADNEQVPLFTNKGNAFRIGFTDKDAAKYFKYSDGVFSSPNLMEVHPEYSPWWSVFISPEEDYLIFAGGTADPDLYIRFRTSNGTWGNPVNMGSKINTKEWERFPVVSPDGKYLFFTRGGTGLNNLFWVSTALIDSIKKSTTGIRNGDDRGIPHTFKLNQNYPNPFNPTTSIMYELQKTAHVRLVINNMLGKVVAELVDEVQNAGSHIVEWNASDRSSGIYIYQIHVNEFICSKKMVYLK